MPRNRIHFVVQGPHAFPLDMLRYDACWPRGIEDVALITESFDPETRTKNAKINLLTDSGVTAARWNSFGFAVINQRRA